MKRRQHYSLEKELTKLWEKMRCHDVSKEERSKAVSQAIHKMDGKYLDIATSHVTARVLQTCVKWCSESERDAIFDVLQPHLLTLSCKKYAVFLVKKLIELASKTVCQFHIFPSWSCCQPSSSYYWSCSRWLCISARNTTSEMAIVSWTVLPWTSAIQGYDCAKFLLFDRYNFQAWVADIICPASYDYCDW